MVILIFSQLATLKHVIKSGGSALNLLTRITNCTTNASLYSTESSDKESTNELSVDKNESMISDSMKAYLKRAEAYDEFIQKEEADYELGKLHLANMMGENPETFTQKRIDKAISYLFPSGLFDKRARPIMGNPKEIIPPKKAAEFDSSGRPYHSLFYTTRPNYYQTLYNIVEQLHILNDIEDNMNFNDIKIEGADQLLDLNTYDWISYNSFQNLILEEITTAQYEYFISSMEKLVEHPCSNKAKDFIMNFKKSKKTSSQIQVIPKLMEDVNNRPFVIVKDCKRKTARGSVILRGKGSGIITVNGIPLTNYFQNFQECEQVVFPLNFVNMIDLFDVEAKVKGGGPSGQAGAIRWGIATALCSFVDKDMMCKMRIAGLLTRDWRIRERKKPGQEGARRKFAWNKR